MGNDPNMCAKKQKIEDGNSISRQHSEGTACVDTDLSEFSLMDLSWLINLAHLLLYIQVPHMLLTLKP
jgi:hypothetical protein